MKLIYITGLRKSGTSMVKTLLDGHPDLFTFPANELETFYYSDHGMLLAEKFSKLSDPNQIKTEIVKNSFITRLANSSSKGMDFRPEIDINKFTKRVLETDVISHKELIQLICESMALACPYFSGDPQKITHVVKCVLSEEYVPELVKWFPNIKIVYVLRNPYGHLVASRNVQRKNRRSERQKINPLVNRYPILGNEIRAMNLSYYFMNKWSDLYPENFHVLNYDNLLLATEEELSKLTGFLNIEYNECLLKPTIAGKIWSGNSSRITDKEEGFSSIDPRPASHWKEDISTFEVRLVNSYFTDIIEKHGFPSLESSCSNWGGIRLDEWPVTYVLNRLLLKAPYWFGRRDVMPNGLNRARE